ncbi:hypothetical protein [Ktedonobacter racemifer]|uniref:hypothetical protein n=1 Tax=Ktedonobacter racemifer TaxID=363277 RepID=UPI0012F8A966|nr:hypothetical protein [Ktedonobacter racemifer]
MLATRIVSCLTTRCHCGVGSGRPDQLSQRTACTFFFENAASGLGKGSAIEHGLNLR